MNAHKVYAQFLAQEHAYKHLVSVVFDASNGPAGLVLDELAPLLEKAGVTVHAINTSIDPDFGAHGPDPLKPHALEHLSKEVVNRGAHMGAAFDGDGDRVFVVDNTGRQLSSHHIFALLAESYLKKGIQEPFVADEIVYLILPHLVPKLAELTHPAKVGRYYVTEEMRKSDAYYGAEFSGHHYLKKFFGADSGIYTALEVLQVLSESSQALSSHVDSLPEHHIRNESVRISVPFKEVESAVRGVLSADAHIAERDGISISSGNEWVSVRASNTEPIVRVMAGSPDAHNALFDRVYAAVSRFESA